MVCDCLLVSSEMTAEQQVFIANLYKHLDPHEPFLSQQSSKQHKWLNWIHSRYIKNEDGEW